MLKFPEAKHAFAVNPTGPVPYSGYQVFGIFLVAFSPLPALAACGLRVYSRRLSHGLGLDDWLIFLATALGIPQAVFATLFIRTGYWGIHDADIPPHPWNQGLFWSYMNRVFYTPLLTLVKISALLYLLRIGGTKRSVRLACKALIIFNLAQLLAFFPATVFMCEPVQYAWFGSEKGHCFQVDRFAVALASTNIFTDILTLLVPFATFWGLKLSRKIRFALLTVFTLGILVTVTSVLRLYFIIRVWYLKPEDTHYSLGYALNAIEANLAVVTATIPTLWPLARLWFPAMFESMGINRPYLYPDIEVGYVSSKSRASRRAAGVRTGATTDASPVLRGRVMWLPRPPPPSYIRPNTEEALAGGGGGGGSSFGLTDIRGQRVFGTTAIRRNRSAVDDEDGFEDYHGMIRWAETDREHDEEGSLTNHEPEGAEAARSSSDITTLTAIPVVGKLKHTVPNSLPHGR